MRGGWQVQSAAFGSLEDAIGEPSLILDSRNINIRANETNSVDKGRAFQGPELQPENSCKSPRL